MKRSGTQQNLLDNVGLRCRSTQPTSLRVYVKKIPRFTPVVKNVGWVKRSGTQQNLLDNVGLRCRSTQPTSLRVYVKKIPQFTPEDKFNIALI